MIVSGLWLLVFLVIHVKAFRYSAEYEWPAGGRDLYRLEMENFANPLMVGFYVISMVVVGSHLWHGVVERVPVARPRPPRVDAAHPRRRQGRSRSLIAGGFIVIALWAHFVGGAGAR